MYIYIYTTDHSVFPTTFPQSYQQKRSLIAMFYVWISGILGDHQGGCLPSQGGRGQLRGAHRANRSTEPDRWRPREFRRAWTPRAGKTLSWPPLETNNKCFLCFFVLGVANLASKPGLSIHCQNPTTFQVYTNIYKYLHFWSNCTFPLSFAHTALHWKN